MYSNPSESLNAFAACCEDGTTRTGSRVREVELFDTFDFGWIHPIGVVAGGVIGRVGMGLASSIRFRWHNLEFFEIKLRKTIVISRL